MAEETAVVETKKEKKQNFFKSVIEEMKKVTWPSKQQLRRDTLVVFEFTIIFAVMFAIFDFIIKGGLNGIISLVTK
jgi:preprotein translocase subunit SecE